MAKKLSNLDFGIDINSLCELDFYSLYICKDNLNTCHDDDSEIYYDTDFHLEYQDSASYYGKKDYHIVYSNTVIH